MAKVEIPIQVNIPVDVDKLIEFLKKDGTLVAVVRCKECKFCSIHNQWCKRHNKMTSDNWFCADGERKDGEVKSNDG